VFVNSVAKGENFGSLRNLDGSGGVKVRRQIRKKPERDMSVLK